jgi:hypothetical protein
MAGNKPEEEGKQKPDEEHFQIIEKLNKNCDWPVTAKHWMANEEVWSIADLFIRQWLNNGSDGFGMKNVKNMYEYLRGRREELIEYNLLSEEGRNNSGILLWSDYNF